MRPWPLSSDGHGCYQDVMALQTVKDAAMAFKSYCCTCHACDHDIDFSMSLYHTSHLIFINLVLNHDVRNQIRMNPQIGVKHMFDR